MRERFPCGSEILAEIRNKKAKSTSVGSGATGRVWSGKRGNMMGQGPERKPYGYRTESWERRHKMRLNHSLSYGPY